LPLRQSPCHRNKGQSKRPQKPKKNQIDAHTTPPSRSKLNLTREATLSCRMGLIRGRYRCRLQPRSPRQRPWWSPLENDLNYR
jgi:hypothetical protein